MNVPLVGAIWRGSWGPMLPQAASCGGHVGLRWRQVGPKMAQDRSMLAHVGSKMAQDRSMLAQVGSKTPEMVPEGLPR